MSADAKDAGRQPPRARRAKRTSAPAAVILGDPMYSFRSRRKPLIDFTAHAAQ
ncbi:hypothetical protein ACQUJS_10580 [Ralstonia pseudosolanacearum]|uniref:Hypothethical protein (Modular protein) n=1 Tax=Ralstonia solanacearum TaxID=305 RepID=A0A0S4TLJ8_RALSL|nr:hypothetical protein [Ralstonia pseudosolanacearum]CUV10900.1 Hypothethical protein (modular protein) [Ralstonia solanacearum]